MAAGQQARGHPWLWSQQSKLFWLSWRPSSSAASAPESHLSAAATAARALHPWPNKQPLMHEHQLRAHEDRRGAAQVGWMRETCGSALTARPCCCQLPRSPLCRCCTPGCAPLLHALGRAKICRDRCPRLSVCRCPACRACVQDVGGDTPTGPGAGSWSAPCCGWNDRTCAGGREHRRRRRQVRRPLAWNCLNAWIYRLALLKTRGQ